MDSTPSSTGHTAGSPDSSDRNEQLHLSPAILDPTSERRLSPSSMVQPGFSPTIQNRSSSASEHPDPESTTITSSSSTAQLNLEKAYNNALHPHKATSGEIESEASKQTATRHLNALNPTATPFIPVGLAQLYSQDETALMHENWLRYQMGAVQDMLMNGQSGEYDFDRLGESSRELAFKFMNAVDARARLHGLIEKKYGREAVPGGTGSFGAN